jgi:hypothetical protein
VPPPVCAHLIADDAGNQGIQSAILRNERVAAVATDVKKAVLCMIDEPMHGISAVDKVKSEVADPGRAVWKSLNKFSCGHVVIRETFDQNDRAVLLREAEFAD